MVDFILTENRKFLHQTQNLDEAIPILEKWFDDIHAESERLKKQAEENQIISNNQEKINTATR